MSLIQVRNLTFAYEGSYDNIFENVSLNLDTDWKLGFTGRNGRGKTTFLKLLASSGHRGGESDLQYSGTIVSDVRFDYFPFKIEDEAQMAVQMIEEMIPDFEYWRLQKEIDKLRLSCDVLYRPFYTLSNGERTKLLLAVLFMREGHFLLIDEPTNHLDMEAREIVKDYLNRKKGFILVSHDRAFMDGCIDHILAINKTNIEIQKGNFSSWYENKQRQDSYEISENVKLKKEIRRLNAASDQTGRWAEKIENGKIGYKKQIKFEKNAASRDYIGEQSRRMQQRRKNLERRQQDAVQEKKKLLKNIEQISDLKLSPLQYHARRLVLFDKVSFGYGERCLIKDLSFEITAGDRIALCGKNGCGKTSLMKMILKAAGAIDTFEVKKPCENKDDEFWLDGNFSVGSQLKISYVSQQTDDMSGSLSDYAVKKGIDESLFKAILRKLDFDRIQFEKNIENFSGGQKKKVLLAGSLCEKAHLYIWDEPLNFIDVFSRIQIEKLINEYEPTILFVEHDKTFTEKTAAKTVRLSDAGGIDNY